MSSLSNKTSPVWVFVAWTVVAIPLGWGLYQSITKSKPLFTASSVAQPSAPSAPAK